MPVTVRWASLLTLLEAAALLVAAVALFLLTALHTSTRLWAAFTVAGFALLGAFVLVVCSRGLRRGRASARIPVVLLQLLALPVGYSLGFQAGDYFYGVPMLVVAIAVLGLLFTPSANTALGRMS